MARCAGVQNESRPIDSCHEMSQCTPIIALVMAATEVQIYQGVRGSGVQPLRVMGPDAGQVIKGVGDRVLGVRDGHRRRGDLLPEVQRGGPGSRSRFRPRFRVLGLILMSGRRRERHDIIDDRVIARNAGR